jgi:hypothetical protein
VAWVPVPAAAVGRGRRGRAPLIAGLVVVAALVITGVCVSAVNLAGSVAGTVAGTSGGTGGTGPAASGFVEIRAGIFHVGSDVQPGTYRTRTASPNCYWSRLSGFGGTRAEVIANDNDPAPGVITIAATDKGFQTSGCAPWTTDLSAITKTRTAFADGVYIVGTDVVPGLYRAPGGSDCYWARLKGFGGTLSDLISHDTPTGRAAMTITTVDRGFKSSGCGTWSS